MSRITVTILGTTAGAPTPDRGHSGVLIVREDAHRSILLLDCGEGAQRQVMRAGVNLLDIDAVFITHLHGDHCLGLPGMVDTMGFDGRTRPLAVYSPEPRRISKLLGAARSHRKFAILNRPVPLWRKTPVKIYSRKGFSILSAPVSHGIPAVAYCLKEEEKLNIDPEKAALAGLPDEGSLYQELKERRVVRNRGRMIRLGDVSRVIPGKIVVYSGDTEICSSVKTLSAGADLLVHDCTYLGDAERSYKHASLPQVELLAEECGVKKVILTHFSRKYADVDIVRRGITMPDRVQAATDLFSITL